MAQEETVLPQAHRTAGSSGNRFSASGGKRGSRLSCRFGMSVGGDTLFQIIVVAENR